MKNSLIILIILIRLNGWAWDCTSDPAIDGSIGRCTNQCISSSHMGYEHCINSCRINVMDECRNKQDILDEKNAKNHQAVKERLEREKIKEDGIKNEQNYKIKQVELIKLRQNSDPKTLVCAHEIVWGNQKWLVPIILNKTKENLRIYNVAEESEPYVFEIFYRSKGWFSKEEVGIINYFPLSICTSEKEISSSDNGWQHYARTYVWGKIPQTGLKEKVITTNLSYTALVDIQKQFLDDPTPKK